MKVLFFRLMVILTLISSLGFAAGDWPNSISAIDANGLVVAEKAILIDVREENEVATGMAASATWYAKSKIDADLAGFITFVRANEDVTPIIYCRSGRRASVIVELLAKEGIFSYNMGGFDAWIEAGLPTKTHKSEEATPAPFVFQYQ